MSSFDDDVLRNYTYLGYSYNILKLDPTDLLEIESDQDAKDDPPIATNPRNVVDMNAQGFEPTGDQPYLKPKNTIYQSTPGLKDEVFAKYQRNVSEYYEQHTTALSLGLGIVGGIFGFTASRSYTTFVQESSDKERLAVYSHQYVQNHRLALSESESAVVDQVKRYFKLGHEFQNRVKALPNSRDSEEDRQKYKTFIENVGTHYTWQVGFGGLKNNYSYVSKDSYERLEMEGTNVNLGAEWSFKKLTGQVGADFDNEDMRRFQEETAEYYHKIITLGGSPGIADLEDWIQTIPDNPIPVKIKLALVYELLIPELFEDEPDINRKRDLMEEAYQDYLKENGIPSETRSVLTVIYDNPNDNNKLYQFDYTALEWPPENNNDLEWNKATPVSPNDKHFYPAVAWYENKESIYAVSQNTPNSDTLLYSELYQFGWSSKLLTHKDSSARFENMTLAEFNDKLYCVFPNPKDDGYLYYLSFDRNNNSWSSVKRVDNIRADRLPGMAVYNNKLYCAFKDYHNSGIVILMTMDKSENWERLTSYGMGPYSLHQVGLGVLEDILVVPTLSTRNSNGNYEIVALRYKDDNFLGTSNSPLEGSYSCLRTIKFEDKLSLIYSATDNRLFFRTAELTSGGNSIEFSQEKRIMNNNAALFDLAVRKSNLPLVRPTMN
ncbi:MAG: hypothetical protein F6K58_10970 [Symploca sp. SIO2E9]|nr:hypothetical protein [Symploca sp. SIO2E9]